MSLRSFHRKSLVSLARRFSTRSPANQLILDSDLIATNPDLVRSHLQSRKFKDEGFLHLEDVRGLKKERSLQIQKGDTARSSRKVLSKQIGALMQKGDIPGVEQLKAKVKEANDISEETNKLVEEIDAKLALVLLNIPNLVDDSVPDGDGEEQNIEIRSWGEENKKIGTHLWHDEIATKLNGWRTESAVSMSGSRFSALSGDVARLERALGQYFLDFHSDRGYTEVSAPYIVSRSCLEGTGQLPKFEEDLFRVNHKCNGEDAFLIPTAEVSITNLYRNEIINPSLLPIQHVSLSPCFRAEVGSHGKDSRGLFRQHQFHKVELIKICSGEGDISRNEHSKMVIDAEALLQSLGLPYRVVQLCSGDLGFTARICYDIEVWLPGQQLYREISSISNCYEYQARRMNMRTRPYQDSSNASTKKLGTVYPHTINGSGVAIGRALAAVLENYWDAEHNVLVIPEVLRKYMRNKSVIN